MKKPLMLMLLLSINLAVVFFFWQYSTTKADQKGPIPQDAIRLRILANSDSLADQTVKRQVRDAVNANITRWVQRLKTTDQAKQVIRSHMPEIRRTIDQTLRKAHADSAFKVKLGKADFPTKMYGNFVYPAGKYDALVVTLGDGRGANWWCVLFPPLCFLDFSNSEAVANPNAAAKTETAPQSAEKTADTGTQVNQQPKQETPEQPAAKADKVEVHSFIADFFSKVWHSIAG
ncbi:stage II sporulation protein R [Sporolactobacillus laevolacticus]|uniref:Stage II sporulation protein R n=1 Tax=Sporolactobacillus laevolacticus DSM 442 TaxID=1395513 RepID=V6IYA7_9BACL|nr:stage II sporulation protein R [Sporolactobacillus laevolacticus]EST12402.1 stage II sporulation protein R [Sporolactobacillus laevolacticus DSM 442]MDN3955259.1 stage II sporulation protein R [Sporolactobacillus laevolacticus]